MKTRYFVPTISAALALLPILAPAQNRFSLEIFGGRTYHPGHGHTITGWDDGWTVGLGISYAILPGFLLTANESFSNFLFTPRTIYPLMMMAQRRASERGVTSIFGPIGVHGDNTQMNRTAIGVRITSTQTSVRPFLSLETGFTELHVGKIQEEWPRNPGEIPNPGHENGPVGSTLTNGFGSIGFGIFAPLNTSISLIVESKWFDTWNNGSSYFPVTAAVSIQL